MGFEVIVCRRNKAIVERLSCQPGLYGCTLFQGIIIGRKRIGILAGIVLDSCSLAGGQNLLQGAQGIEGTREAGIGIKLRKRFLGFAYGQTIIQRFGSGFLQIGLVAFGFQRRHDGKSLPTGGKCIIHSLLFVFVLGIPDQWIEHAYLTSAEFVFLTQGCRFLHHGRCVVAVQCGLVGPFVYEEETVGVIGREKIVVADTTFHGADAVSDAFLLHFLYVFLCGTLGSGVADIDGELGV